MLRFIPPFVVCLGLSLVTAQDLKPELKVTEGLLVTPNHVPDVVKVVGLPQESAAEFHNQDLATLETKRFVEKTYEEIPEMASIRDKSVYHALASAEGVKVSTLQSDRLSSDLQVISAVYRKAGQHETDCVKIALSVRQRVKKDPDTVLQIVDAELRTNPDCSCEIVKSAIRETDMQVSTVVSIVKVAFAASPENMRLIAQCAIAACPEALSAIQELLSQYVKHTGTGDSAKGEKAAMLSDDEVAALADTPNPLEVTPNPLDFPGGPVGYSITFIPPPLLIINPGTTTSVNP